MPAAFAISSMDVFSKAVPSKDSQSYLKKVCLPCRFVPIHILKVDADGNKCPVCQFVLYTLDDL